MAAPGPFANPTSIAETPKVLIFPSSVEVKSQIPLWMKFYCFEYNNSSLGRAAMWSRTRGGGLGSIPGASLLKTQIAVPAPANFTSTTQHSYKAEDNDPSGGLIATVVDYLSETQVGKAVKDKFEEVLNDPRTARIQSAVTNLSRIAGYGQNIDMDHSELVYKPNGSVRQYEIQLYMPCLNVNDSKTAGQIIRAFEAFSLPTLVGVLEASFSMMFHPPLWAFGVGPMTSLQMDPDWSGMPQVCVLKTVKSKKMALDTNSLAAIANSNSGEYKPIAYLLSLVFQELEPAVRLTSPIPIAGEASSAIASRSGALLAAGNALAAKATQG